MGVAWKDCLWPACFVGHSLLGEDSYSACAASLMTKTEVAYRMSAEELFRVSKRVYFWTFTFLDVQHDWVYSRMWARFWKDFTDHSNYFIGGIKVAELHRDHGIHYHCLLDQRLPVDMVRRIGRKYGIGRVQVAVAKWQDATYLTKYLGKGYNSGLAKHIRRWGTVGAFKGTQVRDLQVDTAFTRALMAVKGERQMTWSGVQVARGEFARTGRVSIPTVTNNLVRPRLGRDNQMLAEVMLMRSRSIDDDWEEEVGQSEPELVGYASEPKKGTSQFSVVSIVSQDGQTRRGAVVGYAPRRQAELMCQYLNEKLKKNRYTV